MAGLPGYRHATCICTMAFGSWLLLNGARALELSSGDGLSLTLADASGAVTGIAVNDRHLPLLPGEPGGLTVREWQVQAPTATEPTASVDFETRQGWSPSTGASAQPDTGLAVEQRTDGGADGSRGYVRLGANRQYGHGVRLAADIAVTPGRNYALMWQARVPDVAATYIVYVRVFDAAGVDMTPTSTPPKGWEYSPSSKTHFQNLIAASRAGVWEGLSRQYRVPEGAATLRVAICLWRGEYVDLDRLGVEARDGGAVPGALTALTGPVARLPDGKSAVQHLAVSALQLDLRLTYSPGPAGIRIDIDLRDTSTPPRDRALDVSYRLPLQTLGWSWHDDIRRQRRIEAGITYGNGFSYAGHAVSSYPFSCISGEHTGLMLALPLDSPAVERRFCRADTGFVHTVDVGLSPATSQMGPGRARWSLVLSRVEPRWGFRAAAATYYALFPQFFAKRTQQEGAWLWPTAPDRVPHPEDFGLAFWETHAEPMETCAAARREGIQIMHYIEPSGLRQWFPELRESMSMYSPQECLAGLRTLADDTTSTSEWNGGPRAEIARAVLNSLPGKADGTVPGVAEKHYGPWDQWWFTNPSPYLPIPNRGSTCWTYEVVPALAQADGIYVDSVQLAESTGIENHRPEHLAAARGPLSFGLDSARPNLPGFSSYHDFLAWLGGRLHDRNKLLMLNIAPTAYRFFAYMGDVLGSETGSSGNVAQRRLWEVEADEASCLRRTYAYRRPTTNLLQEANYAVPAPVVSHAEIEQYIKQQMFYGFYPGVSTIGGEEEPGYAKWKRYFSTPEQYERDRDLFRKYVPVIRRLNAAGWEPVTYATTSRDRVFIERYGAGDRDGVLFALRNPGDRHDEVTVTIQAVALGLEPQALAQTVVRDVLSGTVLRVRVDHANGNLEVAVSMPPRDTMVVALERPAK